MDLDLRKYHINSVQELVSFLELFEARVPEIIRQVKKMQMQNASLENVVANERKKRQEITEGRIVNNNVPKNSVSLNSEQDEATVNAEAARLAQMREASENATKVFGTHPKAQVTAGEVGQLAQKIKEESATVTSVEEVKEEQPPVENKPVTEGGEQFAEDINVPTKEEPKAAAPKRQGLKKNVKK